MRALLESAITFLLGLAGVLLVVILWGWYVLGRFVDDGELGDKQRWANLQATAQRVGAPAHAQAVLVRHVASTDLAVLGLPARDDPHHLAWIGLNQKDSQNRPVELGEAREIHLDCARMAGLLASVDVLPEVAARLEPKVHCPMHMAAS